MKSNVQPNPRSAITKTALAVIFLLVVLFAQNLTILSKPFWQIAQDNPLLPAYACAAQFKPQIAGEERLGYFYQQPQRGFVIYDKRIAPQIQLQYALIPQVLDHRPEQIGEYDWVVGYFINEKVAAEQGRAMSGKYGWQVAETCGNYVLFQRVGG
jgi:hypothetical protein